MVKELAIPYHKSKLDFPPLSPPYLVSVSLIQMQTLPNEKVTCYRAQNVFGHVYTCMNHSNLLQRVWSKCPAQHFFKQLVSSSKQQTQNGATDTAICNMINIFNLQLLVSSSSAQSEAKQYFFHSINTFRAVVGKKVESFSSILKSRLADHPQSRSAHGESDTAQETVF